MDQITEEFLWKRLQPLLQYLDDASVQRVRNALSFAWGVHAGQMRKSGEPYITHPLEVILLVVPTRRGRLNSLHCEGCSLGKANKKSSPFPDMESSGGNDDMQVARLLAELRMDMESLCAGLLHDTVEDNPHVATFEEIEVSVSYIKTTMMLKPIWQESR